MKVIQIGIGEFGFSWLKDILLQQEDIEVIGVVATSQRSLKMIKDMPGTEGTKLFTGLEEALHMLTPDFILNVTPPAVHKKIDLIALQNGIPVLSEKPISENYNDAKEIWNKSHETKVPIMIAENYRYTNLLRTSKRLLSSGEIGKIDNINVNFSRNHKMTNYIRDLQHPLLLDVSIHHIDMMRYLTDAEAKTIFAKSWSPKNGWYKGYSNLEMLVDMNNDIKISYKGSLSSFKNDTDWFGDWKIEGEKGVLYISQGKIKVNNLSYESEILINESIDSRKLVLDEFIQSLKEGRAGETDIKDNIKNHKIIDDTIRSIESSQRIIC